MTAPAAPLLYLVSRYPQVSQTFIRREVDALRVAGLDVRTASLHPTPEDEVLGAADEAAAAETLVVLRPSRPLLVRAAVRSLLELPVLLRALLTTVRTARGLRARAWQAMYLAEAVLLREACIALGVRHVHVHFTNNAADAARLAVRLTRASRSRRGPATYSMTVHGPTEFYDVRHFDVVRKVREAAYVVCISDFARSQLMAHSPVADWAKLHVVRCGVAVDEYAPAVPGRPPSILCVGRLVPEKGQPLLVEALAGLRDQGLDFRAVLVGGGSGRHEVESAVAEHRVQDRVRLTGPLSPEEVTALYRDCDIFCLPSFAEGVPIVLMEAMASRLPVLTTAVAGIPELVQDGVSGRVVPPGDVSALRSALRELLLDERLRRTLGVGGRRKVELDYDLRRNASTLAQLHEHYAATPDAGTTAPAAPGAPRTAGPAGRTA